MDVSEIPASPLTAREGSSGFLVDNDFIVWGGFSGQKIDRQYHDDGAAYDTGTREWRPLPGAPMRAQYGHVAAMHPTGVAVFEVPPASGSEDYPISGHYLDLEQDEWNETAPPPFDPGVRFEQDGVTVGDHLLFHTSEYIYSYDAESDEWATHDAQSEVHRILTAAHPQETGPDSEFYTVEENDAGLGLVNRRISDLTPINVLPIPDSAESDDYGIFLSEGDSIFVFLWLDDEVRVMRSLDSESGRGWEQLDTASRGSFYAPYSTSFPDSGVMFALDDKIISSSPLGFSAYDVGNEEFFTHAGEFEESHGCGAGSALSPTESGIIMWGGQSCRPGGSGQIDTGYEVTIDSHGLSP